MLGKELKEYSVGSKPAVSPIEKHEVTKEYRTKMTDWMVEVCTSFKCAARTYFLAVTLFDRVLVLKSQKGITLTNKDVHCIGVTAMYLASKYEDIYPLHSKIVSEKIAHKAISARDILRKEAEFLEMFGFQCDFVTLYDLYQTFIDQMKAFHHEGRFKLLKDMAMLLIKMAMQSIEFSV